MKRCNSVRTNMGNYHCKDDCLRYCTGTPCEESEVLRDYDQIRREVLEQRQPLSAEAKALLKEGIKLAEDVGAEAIEHYFGVPLSGVAVGNFGALNKLASEDPKVRLEGARELYANQLPGSVGEQFKQMLRDIQRKLENLRTTAPIEDELLRKAVSDRLQALGCPADLNKDYELPLYEEK